MEQRSRRAALIALLSLTAAAALTFAPADRAAAAMPAASATTAATPPEVAADVPGATLIGKGRLTYFGLHVYDARLWATDDFKPADFSKAPLALELEYARSLVGKQIAERSLDEMKRSGEIAADKAARWLAEMTRLFPDVAAGDRITGVLLPGTAARFFFNGKLRGEVRDAEFAQRFFGIWLSPRTSEPKLRESLLGGRGTAS